MTKAMHEAKVHTSWINPNEAYDEAVAAFVARIWTSPTECRVPERSAIFSGESAISG